MRVAVTGATGNVGSAVLRALQAAPEVDEIVGVARRPGPPNTPKTRWAVGDVRDRDHLKQEFTGADAVIHLAWAIQPSRDRDHTRTVNVDGSHNVFAAATDAGVGTLVHASSVGAYSPADDRLPHGEDWPTGGISESFYSRDKAAAESRLDAIEASHPTLRVVRLRPALIFQRAAASEIRRLFAGPLLPGSLLRPGLLPVMPHIPELRFQSVHSDDVAEAYRLAVLDDSMQGAYNVASEEVLGTKDVAALLRARPVRVPYGVVRAAADASYRARLQPTEAGWMDLGSRAPVMSIDRLHAAGWKPRHFGRQNLEELLEGLRDGAGDDMPPLARDAGGPARIRELLTGLGAKT